MVKSFSQDASSTSSIVKNAAVAMSNLRAESEGRVVSSASDSQLAPAAAAARDEADQSGGSRLTVHVHSPLAKAKPLEGGSSEGSLGDSSSLAAAVSPSSNDQTQDGGANGGDSCCSDTASISSSMTDLSTGGDKKKKRRSFFNFRRSKREQKKEVIL